MLEMKYFILKPRAKDKHDIFARASQDAMIAYSERIRTTDNLPIDQLLFADQVLAWATKEKTRQDKLR